MIKSKYTNELRMCARSFMFMFKQVYENGMARMGIGCLVWYDYGAWHGMPYIYVSKK